MKFTKHLAIALVSVVGIAGAAIASGADKHPEKQKWSSDGPLGQYDQASLQRGWQVYKQVCSNCHALKYFRFRNLADLGYSADEIKAFAKEYEVAGEPDEVGDETVRAALPQDTFPSPFPNDNAARASNGGALPPDLSLMTRARHDGKNYMYSLITGYEDAPEGRGIADDKSYNPYFKGGQISMAPPLFEGAVEYDAGQPEATAEQMAHDVVEFLSYVSDPTLGQRHELGFKVIIFLLLMTIIFFFSMKKIWRSVKAGKNFYEED